MKDMLGSGTVAVAAVNANKKTLLISLICHNYYRCTYD